MLKFKLESDKSGNIKFKIKVSKELEDNIIIKRAIFEGKKLKGNKEYNYLLPSKYLVPIINNFEKSKLKIDKKSLLSILEFSDEYEEKFYYTNKADAKYMKKWRDEGCPTIFKIILDIETLNINKEVAFERLL
ncbi:MAG: hypothetical protein ACRC41_11430 [Sarcina sp.]